MIFPYISDEGNLLDKDDDEGSPNSDDEEYEECSETDL